MRSILLSLAAVLLLVSLTGSASLAGEDTVIVFTSIVPQEYFTERIGGDRVKVQALVRPGSSPATYEPTPRQMAALSRAQLYLRIGVPFENALLPKVAATMEDLPIIDTRTGIHLRTMKAHHHHAEPPRDSEGPREVPEDDGHQQEDHDPHHEHAHEDADGHHADQHGQGHAEHAHHEEPEADPHHPGGGRDPHIWLSPRLVKIQARTIAEALIEVDPAGKAVYQKNLATFLKDLDALDAKLTEALAPVKGKTFMVFHPAWGYFADAYGLQQHPIEIEGKAPSAKQLAHVIFVQPQFSRDEAKRVAEAIGGAVVPINPLARDYIANLERVASTVREALVKQR